MKTFRGFLLDAIDRVDRAYWRFDQDERLWKDFADLAAEAGDRAARLGFADLHEKSLAFGNEADAMRVKTFLSDCLSAVPETREPASLLSVDDVASKLQVSPSHVYRLADGGKMPRPAKIGGAVRWVRSELDAWVAGGCKSVRSKV